MIYTITLNPAIDLVIITKKLEPNIVNRTENFELQPNGKGVNVSFILKKMGIEISQDILTIEEMVGAICQLKSTI